MQEALKDDRKILHLLNRFSWGATPELVDEVRKAGWKEWFEGQLKGDRPESEAFRKELGGYETLSLTLRQIAETYEPELRKANKPTTEQAERREAMQKALTPLRELKTWILLRAAASANQVREVSADFFRNHFSVAHDKDQAMLFLVPDWERQVIAKHALGKFGDMLDASAHHPAMLFFLDNHLSRRPATAEEIRQIEAQTRRRTRSEERAEEAADLARQRGLNENYARELLELHTYGVDNGYTQQDVIEVAKCLTGWTFRKSTKEFQFDGSMHCGGDKKVLGTVIRENKAKPMAEGEQVLDLLKGSATTARFLAWKLCRWFVNDAPDDGMVGRVAKVFRQSGGDLPAVLRAIVEDAQFFAPANYRAKFKRPSEYVVSALRAMRADVSRPIGLDLWLAQMSEPLYKCADPTGFYDQAEAWNDPGAMAPRWTFASDLVNNRVAGVRIPSSFWDDLPAGKPREWRAILEKRILPVDGLAASTAAGVDRVIGEELKRTPRATPERLGAAIAAMILGSPEFQKQ